MRMKERNSQKDRKREKDADRGWSKQSGTCSLLFSLTHTYTHIRTTTDTDFFSRLFVCLTHRFQQSYWTISREVIKATSINTNDSIDIERDGENERRTRRRFQGRRDRYGNRQRCSLLFLSLETVISTLDSASTHCSANPYRFEFSAFGGIKPTTYELTVPRPDQLSYFRFVSE